ncbi:MAG TPA: 30S ribosomal protein S17 [Syntrophales bacterium]|jgi:small subunit ribosomal protein S17|nr:30S ribosomal protein S17 [Syntrophales bacterium]
MDQRGNKRTIKGVVVSNKMDKTVVVKTERLVKHAGFRKYMRQHQKYKAHDERNECGIGDTVMIVESRPLSRDKRWRVREILEKAK